MTSPRAPEPSGDFLTVAAALDLLTPAQVDEIATAAAARQSPPSQAALTLGLLSPAQVDIVETLLRPTEAIPGYEILGLLGAGGHGRGVSGPAARASTGRWRSRRC